MYGSQYDECPEAMRGRHDAELKALKDGQLQIHASLKDLTISIKEFVALTQELQSTRITDLEKRQDTQEIELDALGKGYVGLKGKTNFTYYVIIGAAGTLIAGMVTAIFGMMWAHTTTTPGKVSLWLKSLISLS